MSDARREPSPPSSALITDQAVSRAVDHLLEASRMDREVLAALKRAELADGLTTEVTTDEWLSSAISQLLDERGYAYPEDSLAMYLGCDNVTVRQLTERPADVPLDVRYACVGRLARLLLLLAR